MKKRLNALIRKNKSSFAVVILIIFLVYLFLPDKETIQESIQLMKQADPGLVILATALFFITIPLNAMQIRVVSDIQVRFWITLKVQFALQFIGKLLPSSISAFVVNSFYLHQIGHTSVQTASVIAIKAVSSSVAFMILTLATILIGLNSLKELNLSSQFSLSSSNLGPILIAILIGLISISWVLLKMKKTRELINKTIGNFWDQFKSYKNRKLDVLKAIVYSLILTTFQALTLFACSLSLGLEINFVQVFIIFTIGNAAAMLVPTPGGVGAAEAGLYAGFVLLNFPESESLAVVNLYRIITFWIPTIPGFIAFVNLRKDLLADFSINKDMFKKQKSPKAATA